MRGPFIVNAERCVGFFERFLTPWYNSDPWQDILCQFNMVRSCNTICGPTPGHWTLKLFVQIQIYVWADRVPVWPLGHREEASKCQKEERPKIRFSSSDKTHKSVFSSRKKSVRNGALGCKLWGGGGGGGDFRAEILSIFRKEFDLCLPASTKSRVSEFLWQIVW